VQIYLRHFTELPKNHHLCYTNLKMFWTILQVKGGIS
jgi:hypothetical protein